MSESSNDRFYENLAPFTDFADITVDEHYADLPEDWHVVVTDIQGSTRAIQEGRYRDVNLVGAASIMAILNAVRPLSVPYVFGGDGASVCVPHSSLPRVRGAALLSRQMAEREFGLTLRTGIVPLGDIRKTGSRVRVAKYRISAHVSQAMFSGGGLACADDLVKDPQAGALYQIDPGDTPAAGDFTGLECRWRTVPSVHGEVICLLVVALAGTSHEQQRIYRDVIEAIHQVYGGPDDCHPIRRDRLELARSGGGRRGEVRVHAGGRGALRRCLGALWLNLQVAAGRQMMRLGIRLGGTDWGGYRDTLVANTDFRKFDDMLRMVISGTARRRETLCSLLDERRRAGDLAYGVHAAPESMLTCLIFNYAGEHLHFVDGADGGYAMAARMLKAQLRDGPK